MKLMIVESPNKTRKIEEELGGEWKVLASAGHIRDMPREAHRGEAPRSLDDIGIDGENFSLRYEFLPPASIDDRSFPGGRERVERLKRAADKASAIYLATDPDREGEAISWHLKEALGLDEDGYQRVTFNEINGKTIRAALTKARKIDLNLVHAQEARRALDRMVGYLVSPVLSELLGVTVSVGRVQSIATRLVVDRERGIKVFRKTDHFGAAVSFDGASWQAQWVTDDFVSEETPFVLDESLARRAAACRAFRVLASQTEVVLEAPPKPFSTSLMLRAASVALHLDPEVTAKLAQRLFEQGAITYIRTDSVNFSAEATEQIRDRARLMGFPLPEQPRRFRVKDGAQEAHEAIRPSHMEVETAGETDDEHALYRLIWRRAIASQLTDARYRVNTVMLASTDSDRPFHFKANSRVQTEKGWRALTAFDAADESEEEDAPPGGGAPLPQVGSSIVADYGAVVPKQTLAPRRYTKASLIEKLENEGIGRPATYPSIMATILSRGYVTDEKGSLVPSELGASLVDALAKAGFGFMDVAFTRHLEERLDAIADGKAGYREVLAPAYRLLHEELAQISGHGVVSPRFPCPKCGSGLYRSAHPSSGAYWHCHDGDCGHYMDDVNGRPVERPVHACPKCQSLLRRFQRKDRETGKPNGFAWCCTNFACKTFLDDEKGSPVAQRTAPCLKCGRPMLRRKNMKGVGYWWGCSGYKDGCTLTMDDQDGKPVSRDAKRAPRGGNVQDSASRRQLDRRRRKR